MRAFYRWGGSGGAAVAAATLLACAPARPETPVVTAVIEPAAHPPGVDPLTPEERLLALLTEDNPRVEDVAVSLARLGDEGTRREAAQRLVAAGRAVVSKRWRPAEDAAGDERALEQRRTQALTPILAAMGRLGGPAVVAFAFALAEDEAAPLGRRRLALRLLDRAHPPGDVAQLARRMRIEARLPSPVRPGDIVGFLRRAAKQCYEQARKQDPGLVTTQVRLTLRFATDGTVTSSAEGSAPEGLQRCLVEAANRFQATEGVELAPELVLPFSFVKQ